MQPMPLYSEFNKLKFDILLDQFLREKTFATSESIFLSLIFETINMTSLVSYSLHDLLNDHVQRTVGWNQLMSLYLKIINYKIQESN